jgi:hypothetical protein
MSTPTSTSYPSARSGKPINIGDQCTVVATVTSVSGTGPSATVNVTLLGSGNLVAVQAQDVAATAQTL